MASIKKIPDGFFALLFAWVFVIEATTFYVRSNTVDNLFQLACCLAMLMAVMAKSVVGTVYIDPIFLCYVLLVAVSVMPDIVSGSMAGIKKAFIILAPLIVFLFVTDYYHKKKSISHKVLLIPLAYGLFVIVQGLMLEALNLAGVLAPAGNAFIEKTGNYVTFAPFGLGAFAYWGRAFGKDLVRLQGYYIEPSKAAAFLTIPIFISWGFYRKYKKIRYALLTAAGAVCLVFTMSRAGMVAAVGAIVVGYVMKPKKSRNGQKQETEKTCFKDIKKIFLAGMSFLIAAVLLIRGMVFLSKFFPALSFLHVGITDKSGRANLIRNETVDFSYLIDKFTSQPWGYGFTGSERGWGLIQTNLANAFIFWLMIGGCLGGALSLLILAIAMYRYGIPAFKSQDPLKRSLAMVFVALTLHSLSYGTWMSADYLMALALLCAVKGKEIV